MKAKFNLKLNTVLREEMVMLFNQEKLLLKNTKAKKKLSQSQHSLYGFLIYKVLLFPVNLIRFE